MSNRRLHGATAITACVHLCTDWTLRIRLEVYKDIGLILSADYESIIQGGEDRWMSVML